MVTVHRPTNAKWKIAVYPGADHGTPHFHIEGPGYRCSIAIESLEMIIGSAPRKVLAAAKAWAAIEDNKARLRERWMELAE